METRSRVTLETMANKDIPFLDWIKIQTESISAFANIVEKIAPGQEAVSMSRLREVLAKFTSFYVTQTSFLLIYKEYKTIYEKEYDKLKGEIYLEVKQACSNPESVVGKKYAKKSATMAELEMELAFHPKYKELEVLKEKVDDLNKKEEAQEKYLRRIDKLDSVLQTLNSSSKNEVKFLHLTGDTANA